MISIDFRGKNVLVTGGTRGVGKAIGLEFARAGAQVFLTHRWGSIDENALREEFAAQDLAAPRIVECDASDAKATRELMRLIGENGGALEVVVSNVAFAKIAREIGDLKRGALEISLGYSAWPIVDLVQAAHEVLGAYPRYVLGISSDGGEVCHPGYDLAGASKAVLETLCRYLALRLKSHGVRVHAVRPGLLDTASSRASFGDPTIDALRQQNGAMFLEPEGVGRACLALCSGLMDGLTGQVIVVDEGWSLVSPFTSVMKEDAP